MTSSVHFLSRAKLALVRALMYPLEEAPVVRTRHLLSHTRTARACLSSARTPTSACCASLQWAPAQQSPSDSRPIFFCKRFSYNENAL